MKMNGKIKKVGLIFSSLMMASSSLFATTTGNDDVVTTALAKVADILSGPIIGALFVGIFAVKMLIAYTKHQSHPEDMKKEIITALIFAGVITGAVAFITWLLGTGTGTVATNFATGLQGAVISEQYLAQARALLAAGM